MLSMDAKLERLSRVATMYYEQDMTQHEIAKELDISRPMISKLLKEARDLGIVTITIRRPLDTQQMLAERFGLREVLVVRAERSPGATNAAIARQILSMGGRLTGARQSIGLGWGSMIGELVSCMETAEAVPQLLGDVFPLIGGIKASFRSYHPNELVRLFSEKTGMNAAYLYMPAIFDSEEEKRVYERTEAFREIEAMWSRLTAAVINISNYPSSPDIATATRFGARRSLAPAVGNFLDYYFDREGRLIEPEQNIVIQISLEQLRRAPVRLAVAGSLLRPEGLLGALRTGLFTHLALSDELAAQLFELV